MFVSATASLQEVSSPSWTMSSLPACLPASEERVFSRLTPANGSKGTLVEESDWSATASYDSTAIEDSDDDDLFMGGKTSTQLSFCRETVNKKDRPTQGLLTTALSGKNDIATSKRAAVHPTRDPSQKTTVTKPRRVVHFSKESQKPGHSEKCYQHFCLKPLGFSTDKVCIYEKTPDSLDLSKVHHHCRCLCDKRFVAPCPAVLRENKSWYDLVEQFQGSTF
ncbi:hypothetical protein G7054_g13280 [Neopestalotiopsis clavispora]|nr:hypothetical protein G7054_g13280 [Neopestalotiopsis clavispora]